MRDADRRTIETLGVPSMVLMENAGRQVVAAIDAEYPRLASMRVAVLCGRGNNGGDGFVVARALAERRVNAGVYLVARVGEVQGDAAAMLEKLRHAGGEVAEVADDAAWEHHRASVLGADLIVDAMFGTGLARRLSGPAERVVNDVNASGRPVVAVDVPSGVSADTAEIIGPAIRASMTVTFAAPKLPLVLPPAESLTGRLVVADIGIPQQVVSGIDGPRVETLTAESLAALIEPRLPDSHKGTYGRVLIVAGSRGKTGAAYLAAMAALRSGAGLVTVATPSSCLPIVSALGAEFMTEPLAETSDGTIAAEALERTLRIPADVIAVGPGLGQSASTARFVHGLVAQSSVPLVVDADALNAFAVRADRLTGRDNVDIIVTPHPGEMARLTGLSTQEIQSRRLEVAQEFAVARRLHVVLKGHRTIVATPAGSVFINQTGNPGMATAGTGDVLTGTIAAWRGQLRDPIKAATLGVFLHGLAGDIASRDEGETALIASDLIARLGPAVLELTGRTKSSTRP